MSTVNNKVKEAIFYGKILQECSTAICHNIDEKEYFNKLISVLNDIDAMTKTQPPKPPIDKDDAYYEERNG